MEERKTLRKIIIYGDHYWDFYYSQNKKTRKRISWVIDVIRTEKFINAKYFKHLEGTRGLYEIRIQAGNDIFRIFCCFDEGCLVVLFNGFQKKSDKTPQGEIERALKLKNEYYESKKK